ncbi:MULTISPECIES: MFS transporter [Streptomyces]|uniref:MFS transporter n=1 Tax=Streptomyces tsukubensis (strain DSM 42081 / NBRC 108919 / NRRL 18488 / 9993) TaxID=1114943 RepID=I2N9C8_STRT9|nr:MULTISPECIES: MFS transporter [Streptomyces]AZK97490.1 MFS transporter [Streptomyces tsukubensis]EIF93625.1 major facilitator superfamily permease [Streptomyces tsukubensis NRRL18488]MYS68273.1 MFS transporter [Streptomyces sp. SID5473]QKM66562.1 MFS transporter [Streptomyces tsukubensis NRRL18488]TAI45095.1 MFS transporter [Streptomyces tsukubensis]
MPPYPQVTGYRTLLTNSRVGWWLVATVGTRLAVCTIPLGVVFAAEEHTGSYAWGAVIACAFAGGEAIGAPRMGARFQHRPLRRELAGVSVIHAVALASMVVTLSLGMPLAAAALAAVGGAAASGTFGGLRTLIVRLVPGSREKALALDVIVNQLCQIAGPALAAAVAVAWTADVPLLIVCGGLLIAAASAVKLPDSLSAGEHGAGGSGGRARPPTSAVIRAIWPSLVVATLVLMLQAVLEVALPGIIGDRDGPPAWAGLALSGLAVTSIVGSFLYGLRRWRGRPHHHTLVLSGVFALIVTAVGLTASPVMTVVLVTGCGFFHAAATTSRSLTVTEVLPAEDWPVGFSLLYSWGAVGFTVASGISALFLAAGNADVLLIAFGVIVLVGSALTWWFERITLTAGAGRESAAEVRT